MENVGEVILPEKCPSSGGGTRKRNRHRVFPPPPGTRPHGPGKECFPLPAWIWPASGQDRSIRGDEGERIGSIQGDYECETWTIVASHCQFNGMN